MSEPITPEKTSEDAKPKRKGISRRMMIIGGVAVGGGVAIGVALSPFSRIGEQRRLVGRPGESVLVSALRIAPDETLTVIYPHADMGTGNGTALAQILAEELDADWSKVRIERAPGESAFANGALGQAYLRGNFEIPAALAGLSWLVTRRLAETMHLQITGGSTAIALTGMEGMRHAGASARYMLTRAAARAWSVPESEITIAGGRIRHASGKDAGFGEFAEASLAFEPPARLPFKTKADYKLIGAAKKRLDIPDKVTGKAVYSGDIRLPGMVHAAIRACPTPGGVLASCDPAPAEGRRGVVKVVNLPNAVAVLADSYWRAKTAVEALSPQWSAGDKAGLDSAAMIDAMRASVEGGKLKKDHDRGKTGELLAAAGEKVVERTYTVPFLAHAAMEPMGCVAHMHDGRLDIWGAFQDALASKFLAMKVAGLGEDKVTIHHTEMGGAFGRRAIGDYLEHAVAIARQTDAPVNLVYSREEDMTHDFYRNASVARMRAALGDDGLPAAIQHHYAERHDPKDASQFPYALDNIDVRFSEGDNGAPWGAWRSVDHSVQGFFIE
jgi:isoquinoline 1-oxidoreductase beta subunit